MIGPYLPRRPVRGKLAQRCRVDIAFPPMPPEEARALVEFLTVQMGVSVANLSIATGDQDRVAQVLRKLGYELR